MMRIVSKRLCEQDNYDYGLWLAIHQPENMADLICTQSA